jgi:hypothetical protein
MDAETALQTEAPNPARIYMPGGTHNFPAERAAAKP